MPTERAAKLIHYIAEKGEISLDKLPPGTQRLARRLAQQGYLQITGDRVKPTPAALEAIKQRPRPPRTKIAITRRGIERGRGSEAYILKQQPTPSRQPEKPRQQPLKLIQKAEKLLSQGKYRYAAATLLPLAHTPQQREAITSALQNPSPRKIAAIIRQLREKLANTQHDKGTRHTHPHGEEHPTDQQQPP